MSRLSRFLGVLRRNPKKSIFFSGLFVAGANFGKNKYEEKQMMRAFCEEALAYGEITQPLGEKERHITVLLNPAAKEGKGKALYEQYCAPLFHLAGIKVATVRTEHEGQARDLMGVMENTSAVVVAGGDGTLAEVLTGLLRRADHKEAASRLPLGVLPLGKTNCATSAIWGFTGSPEPRHLAEAAMAVIRGIKRPLDVMEITPLQGGEEGAPPKPVFAASKVEWGAFRDARERNDVYWYWSVLKKYMTYVFSSYKDISWDCSADIEYSAPCSGCSRCRGTVKEEHEVEEIPKPPQRWWMAYLPRTKPVITPEEEKKIDYNSIINEECGVVKKTAVSDISDLSVVTKNTPESVDIPNYALALKTGPTNVGSFAFIQEGWRREWNKSNSYDAESIVGEITLTPTGNTKTKEGEDRELNIDSETFEVRPMKIKPRPEAVTVFAPLTPPFAAHVG
ncbi:acylglycerol kinase, mitochondrial-like [Penaeus chinensis]|uniref:acylglycerol kinase, mitochondrial-like n=1 Tax=Penaeus chinensis TaxID=139456 RepID=UPI001FB83FE2|nr:acylglycerol kinase, mitochondrial-like [Penaeus chinensis]